MAKVETNGSRDVMQYVASDDVEQAIEAIASDGCVVLENAVSESDAAELAELVLNSPTRTPGVSGYEFVVCLMNHDLRFLKRAMHPTVLELARHQLGGRTEPAPNAFAWPEEHQILLGSVDGLVAHSGSDPGWWHMDSPMGQLNQSRPLPDFPILVNAIWMLTPFSAESGGTLVVPGSHRWPRNPAAGDMPEVDNEAVYPTERHVEGPAGSALVYDSRLWHAVAANRSDQPRVALIVRYAPWWLNLNPTLVGRPEHQAMVVETGGKNYEMAPLDREVFARLPCQVQPLYRHWVG